MLELSLFAHFLYRKPMTHDLTTDAYKRESEINNVVRLMNLFYDLGLVSWNAKATTNDASQLHLSRIFGSKSMMAWADLVHGAICGKLDLYDADDQ